MANTTFSGPVRSQNGFEQITKIAQQVLLRLKQLMMLDQTLDKQ